MTGSTIKPNEGLYCVDTVPVLDLSSINLALNFVRTLNSVKIILPHGNKAMASPLIFMGLQCFSKSDCYVVEVRGLGV